MNKENLQGYLQQYLQQQQNDYREKEKMYKNKILLLRLIWLTAITVNILALAFNIIYHDKLVIFNAISLAICAFGIKVYFRVVDRYKEILKNKRNLLKRLENVKAENQEYRSK